MEKIVDIIDSIAHEKGLSVEKVTEAIKRAFINTAKRVIGEDLEFEAELDEKNKKMQLFQKILVVEDDDERAKEEPERYITISEAKEIDPDIEVGDELRYPIDLSKQGRTAAMRLHNEIEYHIQRLIEDQLFDKYKQKVGTIISGTVTRVDEEENTWVDIDEVKGVLPKRNRIKGEVFKPGDVIKAILKRVVVDRSYGIYLELSRTTPKFLEELLKLEVPEIKDGLITVEKVARIPGERAKVAVTSHSPKIDPVGACVGVKGVRINAVSKELKGESIDCIEYSPIPEIFVARSLSPAIITSVKIEGEKAIVTLPADQKSKAIGKNGINIRLASMLTGYEIELVEKGSTIQTQETEEEESKPTITLQDLFKE
ncbi:transcription termination/antitermination protein NusA [Nitratiruptor sp. YY08-26]|uniref:transcription termination factor NusA n=1 Tax=unclassified Nitratiruptor TaxID=2624044 RepID=UPI0019153526|nr:MULTISPECIES: transcription termination factor NusA [unclassified Nitratiruptor]BCD62767.1 transcription termination/antitermination protein NusA [Nitratiruptor sp. YY08-13]BCD66703.1 transcription termination/antitermination protein NusA [Nitratiruptor sp. YY08-26]